MDPRDRLIVALDVPSVDEARTLVERIGDAATFYKIGLGLQLTGGTELARELKAAGRRVFLDYKYFDIDQTVENAVHQAAGLGFDFLTVHGTGSIVRAAVRGRAGSDLRILSVTVLTSLDANDVRELGWSGSVEELVRHRARVCVEAGTDGLVASPLEVEAIRRDLGTAVTIVTPGIRPSGSGRDDQKRAASPADAIRAGADHLVVGRPVLRADDPRAAAEAIQREIREAVRVG